MVKRARSWINLTPFLLCLLGASQAEGPSAWGYLWEFRTLRLHALTGDTVQLGRLSSAGVVLTHAMVSRRHAEIRNEGEKIVVVDLRSTNGSRLNRQPLRPGRAVSLQPGDLLELADERLLYHESKAALLEDALCYTFLARFVHLGVAVLHDRKVSSLGKERTIFKTSQAAVDVESEDVQVTFPEGREGGSFRPGDTVFVGDVELTDGELRLSLWGLARGGSLVSRRAAFSRVEHGELRVGLAASSASAARSEFENRWTSDGMRFLVPLTGFVLDVYTEERSADNALKLGRSLSEQPGGVALRDAARSLGFLHRLNPTDPELPLLAARAGARWVKNVALKNRNGLDDPERAELVSALEQSKGWVQSAAELGADSKKTRELESEIVEAEAILEKIS